MATNSSERGFFRNAFDAMITARQRQANIYVERLQAMYGEEIMPRGSDRAKRA